MANNDAPHGFTPIKHLSGAPYSGQANKYNIASDYSTALYIGDIVKLAGSADTRGVPTIERAAATDLPVGVITAFEPKPESGLDQKYSPADEVGYAWVCDDPNVIMRAQEDGTLTAGDIGLNTKPTTTAGSIVTGISGEELDYSEAGSTNTLMFKILRLYDAEDNEIGADSECECKFNVHAYSTETGTTAT
ncbi:hypothetical protein LCGC14_0711640 [marine sediment metagenome]|uniref:Uncharacterized protein n=1 Tax=marine sediment metagenome TaxID=412755 RepID=A0A0F9QJE9_9ZZZZ